MSGDPVEQKVAAALEALGIEGHEVLECDPELADTALFCARYGVSLEDSANAILVASKKPAGQLALCMVLATTRLDVNRAVRKAMGVKRLSFASAELTREVTGMLIGGVTPFGLPADLPILVDARVMTRERVVVGGGSRSTKLLLSPAELLKIPGLRVIEDLAKPMSQEVTDG